MIILYQIINKFNILILEKFNIHRFPTLSALALGINRTNYLIPIITGKLFLEIKNLILEVLQIRLRRRLRRAP